VPPAIPPATFTGVSLDIVTIPVGQRFGRIYHARYPNPLGFGKTRSRFSDPRRRIDANRFGVLYLGATLKVCFVEAILRDLRNGAVSDYPIDEIDLAQRRYAEIVVSSPLRVVDLRGDGPIRMGIPSDVAGASRQRPARAWSLATYEHPRQPDGIIYPSRLNEETNLAIYDRAIDKLHASRTCTLIDAPGFADVLNTLKVALV